MKNGGYDKQITTKQQVESLGQRGFENLEKTQENLSRTRNSLTPNVHNLRNQMANIIIEGPNHSPIKLSISNNSNHSTNLTYRVNTPSPIRMLTEEKFEKEEKNSYRQSINKTNNNGQQVSYVSQFNKQRQSVSSINNLQQSVSQRNILQQSSININNIQNQAYQLQENNQPQSQQQQYSISNSQRQLLLNNPSQQDKLRQKMQQQPQTNQIQLDQIGFNNLQAMNKYQNNFNDVSPQFANGQFQPFQQLDNNIPQRQQQQQIQQQFTPQKNLQHFISSSIQTTQTAPPKFAQLSPNVSHRQILSSSRNNLPIQNSINNSSLSYQKYQPISTNRPEQLSAFNPYLLNQTPQSAFLAANQQLFHQQMPQQFQIDLSKRNIRSTSVNQELYNLPNQQKLITPNGSSQNNQQEDVQRQVQKNQSNQTYQFQPQNHRIFSIYQPQYSQRSISIDPIINQQHQIVYVTPRMNGQPNIINTPLNNNNNQQKQAQLTPQYNEQRSQLQKHQLEDLNNGISVGINGENFITYPTSKQTQQQNLQQNNQNQTQKNIQIQIQTQGNLSSSNSNLRALTEVTPDKKRNESFIQEQKQNKNTSQNSQSKFQVDEIDINSISEKKLAQIKDFSKSPSRFFAHVKEQLNKVKRSSRSIKNPLQSFTDQSLGQIDLSMNKQILQQQRYHQAEVEEQNTSLQNQEDSKQIIPNDKYIDVSESKNGIEITLQKSKRSDLSSFSLLERSKLQIQSIKERIAELSKKSTDETPFQLINYEEQATQDAGQQSQNREIVQNQVDLQKIKNKKKQIQVLINAAEYSLELDTDYSPIVDGKKISIFKNNSRIQDSTESLQAQLK